MEREREHTPAAIRDRLRKRDEPNYLPDWLHGGIDGAALLFAVVAGVTGAGLSPGIILIVGVANLVADGFAKAAGSYGSTKAEIDEMRHLVEVEKEQIEQNPEGERAEVREIMAAKGLSGQGLEEAVSSITSDKGIWIETMLMEEHGIPPSIGHPLTSAIHTFLAFVICGAVPLIPVIFGFPNAFLWSIAATALVFFALGFVKSRWSPQSWWRSGLEIFVLGMTAAAIAYAIGYLLRNIVGVEL